MTLSVSPEIHAFPSINPLCFITKKYKPDFAANNRFHLYSSGRAALYFGILSLGLPQGSRILVPAYNCGVEVEAILKAGCSVDYYDLQTNLEADIKNIFPQITEKTKAIVIIHYFGIPQKIDPIIEFCKKNNLILIEDCAHALFSQFNGKWLGSFGDISIFSLQKTYPLPNGGGLLINTPSIRPPGAGKPFEHLVIIKKTVRSIINYLQQRQSMLGALARATIGVWTYFTDHNNDHGKTSPSSEDNNRAYYHYEIFHYTHSLSKISQLLLWKDRPQNIKEKRQRNHELLSMLLTQYPSNKIKLLFPNLDNTTCPLCLVIEIDNRDRVSAEMNKLGINTFIYGKSPHPSVPLNVYPQSELFSNKLLGLPIHQQLNSSHIERIAQTFWQVISNNSVDN